MSEVQSLLHVPVNQLAVKCSVCGHAVPVREQVLGCKCKGNGVRVEAHDEVIVIRHRADTEHGLKPFELVKALS